MAISMPLEELQLLIAGYVLGDLSPEEAVQFEQLLAQNPALMEEVAHMQAALETPYAPAEVTPPAHLRSAILDKVHVSGSETSSSEIGSEVGSEVGSGIGAGVAARSRRQVQLRKRLRGLMEVAAAALIIALGVNNYRLSQALQTAQAETQQYAALTYVLAATEANSQASATVVADPNDLEATIAVKNLPPLPTGKVYALWTVLKSDAPFTMDAKKAILTEVFQVDGSGNFSQTVAIPKAYRSQDLVTKVAVTIEDANAPQRHIGSPILITGSKS
ncbi:anti-sigma factor domain-containing protein [Leptolyngbya sp. FACHB-261]|uniref:anti-sigma factor n=1 Tax=Leptolyngbya sp. FACHB-261 TaxID=2692806 RepID=UPI00168A01C6|nr:anti-sigma factor [Leptolyngbya sp. FACHB-261]MBD2102683.1 anti-sigma factor [Leptolyngbya sp. FACHB-261]